MEHPAFIRRSTLIVHAAQHAQGTSGPLPPRPELQRGSRILAGIIWSVAGLLAAAWTGLMAVLGSVLGWAAQALRQTGAWVNTPPAWPAELPSWLSGWLDAGTWASIGQAAQELMPPILSVVPAVGTLAGWLEPLLWLGWGLGMLALLALAAAVHVWLRRTRSWSFHVR